MPTQPGIESNSTGSLTVLSVSSLEEDHLSLQAMRAGDLMPCFTSNAFSGREHFPAGWKAERS
jgi:hypothetical protein